MESGILPREPGVKGDGRTKGNGAGTHATRYPPFRLSPFAFRLSPNVVAAAAVGVFVLACAALSRAHWIGGFGVETDFYGSFLPDARRIRQGVPPLDTFSGPGYPALLALLGSLLGNDFAAAKFISLVAAPLAAVAFYAAFRQAVSARTVLWMLLLLLAGWPLLQYAITATSDALALALMAGALCFSFRERGSRACNVALAGALVGLAYLTRYVAAVFVPAFLAGLFLANPLRESLRARCRAAALFLVAAGLVVAPWLWLCYRETGHLIHNRNYLNVAMEINGLGSSGDDLTRVIDRYDSLGDVIAEDPARFAGRVGRNLYWRVRQHLNELVPYPYSIFAPAGLLLALPTLRRQRLAFALFPLFLYLAYAMVDDVPRYYLFLVPYYTLAAVYCVEKAGVFWQASGVRRPASGSGQQSAEGQSAVRSPQSGAPPEGWSGSKRSIFGCLHRRVTGHRSPVTVVLSVCLLLTVAGSRQVLRDLLAAEPREMAEAGMRLQALARPGERVVARTGHVAGTAGLEWTWLPEVPDLPALGRWLAANRATYLVYGVAEQHFRPRLAALRDPARAPRWLAPVYLAPDGKIALYRVLPERLPKPRPGEQFTTPDGRGPAQPSS